MTTSVDDLAVQPETIEAYQHSVGPVVFTVTDASGDAVDLSAVVIRLNGYALESDTAAWTIDTTGGEIVISGAGNNIATATLSTTDTASAGSYRYDLWDVDNDRLLKRGPLVIKPAVKDAAT